MVLLETRFEFKMSRETKPLVANLETKILYGLLTFVRKSLMNI